MSGDAKIVEGAGWRQTTPDNGPRTYADLLEVCELGPLDRDDVEVPSVTAILDDAWSKDLTGWHDWLIGRHVENEWPRLVRMTGREVGVEVAQLATIVLAEHSRRGTAVHDVAELEAAGTVDVGAAAYRKAADQGAGPWLPAVVAAFRDLDLRPLELEAVVFGPDAAGTLDGLATVGPASCLLDELDGVSVGDVLLWDNKSRTAGGNKLAIRDSEVPQLGGYLAGVEQGYAIVDGKRVTLPQPQHMGVLTLAPVTAETVGERHWRFTAVDLDAARDAWRNAVDAFEVRRRCRGVGMVTGECELVDDESNELERRLTRLRELDVDEQGKVRQLWPGIPSLAARDAVHTLEGLELLDRVIDNVVTPDDTGRPIAPDDELDCIAAGRDWLVDRIAELAAGGYRDAILDAVRAAAAALDLAPLKSEPAQLGLGTLEDYRAAIERVEASAAADRDYAGTLKVRRQIAGPWAFASDELTAPLRERLEPLPAELRDEVRQRMTAAGISPHRELIWRDVPTVEVFVDDAVKRLEGRQVELELHVAEHGEAVVHAALKLAGVELTDHGGNIVELDVAAVTDRHLERLAVYLEAIADGLLEVDDQAVTVADNGLERLVNVAGGKRQLLNAGRQLVHAGLDVDMPSSSDDVVDSPALAAHVLADLNDQQTATEEAAA